MERFKLACNGFTESKGGLNIEDFRNQAILLAPHDENKIKMMKRQQLQNYCKKLKFRSSVGIKDLFIASKYGDFEQVQKLIANGIDINEKYEHGQTALHKASMYNNLDIVNLLIENGAYINVKDNDGSSPLHFASIWNNLEIVKTLIQNGADINVKNNDGCTPLYEAVRTNSLDTVKELLKKGADADITNVLGETPLFLASEYGYIDILEELLPYSDLTIKNNEDETVLDIASDNIREIIMNYQPLPDIKEPVEY